MGQNTDKQNFFKTIDNSKLYSFTNMTGTLRMRDYEQR